MAATSATTWCRRTCGDTLQRRLGRADRRRSCGTTASASTRSSRSTGSGRRTSTCRRSSRSALRGPAPRHRGTLARVLPFVGVDAARARSQRRIEYCASTTCAERRSSSASAQALRPRTRRDTRVVKVRKGNVGNYTEYLSRTTSRTSMPPCRARLRIHARELEAASHPRLRERHDAQSLHRASRLRRRDLLAALALRAALRRADDAGRRRGARARASSRSCFETTASRISASSSRCARPSRGRTRARSSTRRRRSRSTITI